MTAHCQLAAPLAARLREARAEVTGRWLERIAERATLDPNAVFPTDDLLDHMPLLIAGIADYIEKPGDTLSADAAVVERARELGALRHAQGFSEYEILKEYTRSSAASCTVSSPAQCVHSTPIPRRTSFSSARTGCSRPSLAQEATIGHYLQLMGARIREREERLRAFNRALTHELRNRIGAAVGAGQLLYLPTLSQTERSDLTGVIVRNVDSMRIVLDNLLELTRPSTDTRQQRRVLLRSAIAESIRQLREMARARGVAVRANSRSERGGEAT